MSARSVLAAALLLPALAAAATHEVRIEGMQFSPATLVVKKGDRIVWRNADLVPHTATAAGSFDSKTIAAGRSWSHTVGKAGKFAYGCTLHPTMKGMLVVE